MNQSSITVAIPTYNGARHLAAAIRSVRAQVDLPFELIVVDDRSKDETVTIAERELGGHGRVEVNPERLGLAGNWNRCVALSQTPWVAIFHQDDLMRPGHLRSHVETFEQRSDLGMICGAADVIDDAGASVPASVVERPDLGPVDHIFEPGALLQHLAVQNPVRCSAVTLRKEAHERLGGFDPTYRYAVDWEFWARLARNWPVAWTAAPTVAIRWHPASETHRFKSGTADLDEVRAVVESILERDHDRLDHPAEARAAAYRSLASAYASRAYEAGRAGRSGLARRALAQALRLDRTSLLRFAADPRLAARLAFGVLGTDRKNAQ